MHVVAAKQRQQKPLAGLPLCIDFGTFCQSASGVAMTVSHAFIVALAELPAWLPKSPNASAFEQVQNKELPKFHHLYRYYIQRLYTSRAGCLCQSAEGRELCMISAHETLKHHC